MDFRQLVFSVFTGFISLTAGIAQTQAETIDHQDPAALKLAAYAFVQQLPGIPTDAKIEIKVADTANQLANCPEPQFSATSKTLSGNIRILARCQAPEKWSLFLTVSIYQPSRYFVLRSAADGQRVLAAEDIHLIEEYTLNPQPSLIADSDRIIGLRPVHALKAGSALRYSDLSSEPALTRGQKVKLVAKGKGFQISQEAQLLNNSFDGQITRVQTGGRKIMTGVARSGGIVEIN